MKSDTHRRPSPLSLAAILAGTLSILVGNAAAQEAKPRLPSAETVLDKTIEAQGGREAFEKLTNCVMKGRIAIEMGAQKAEGTLERYKAFPDLARTIVKLGNQTMESGTDGFIYWNMNPQNVTILEGDDKADSERANRFNAHLHWRQLYESVECVGKEEVDGRKCVKLIKKPPTGNPVVAYYDWKNGLPVGTDETKTTERGEELQEDRLSDYREVNGVQVPFKVVRIRKQGGQVVQTITYTYDSIQYNVEIPADMFELPEKVKEKVGK